MIATRFELLTCCRSAGEPIVWAVAWPLLCVRGILGVLHRFGSRGPSAYLFLAAAGLTAASWLTLATRSVHRCRMPQTWRAGASVTAGSFIAFTVLARAAGMPLAIVATPFAAATLFAALAEEVMFRRHLPLRLATMLRRAGMRRAVTRIACVVVPQLTFAVAHAQNAAYRNAPVREFAALFVAGVLLQGLARSQGIWAAAAVHGAINLTIAFGPVAIHIASHP